MNHLPSETELRVLIPVVQKLVSARMRSWTPHPDLSRDDLVQDTLLAVCRSWPRRPANPSEVAPWVNVITQRRVAEAMRNLAKRPPHYDIDNPDHHPLTDPEMVEQHALGRVAHPFELLACLRSRPRWVMQMVAYDTDLEVIARRLDASVGAVRVAIHRSRARITASGGKRTHRSLLLSTDDVRLPQDVSGDTTGLAEACRAGQPPILLVTRGRNGWTAADRFSELALVAAVLENVRRVPVLEKAPDVSARPRTAAA